MKKTLWWTVLVLLLLTIPLMAQIKVPYTFVPGQVANSSQVNANFAALADNALNRAGGTITGNINVDSGFTIDGVDLSAALGGGDLKVESGLFVRAESPQIAYGWDMTHLAMIYADVNGNGTFDLTTVGAKYYFQDPIVVSEIQPTLITCTGCLSGGALVANTLTATQIADGAIGSGELAGNSVGAGHLIDTLGSGGSYGSSTMVPYFTVDTDGRLTAVNHVAITFPTIGTPNSIPETAIIDGALLARMGSNDSITGQWSFTQAVAMVGTLGDSFSQYNAAGSRLLSTLRASDSTQQLLPGGDAQLQIGGTAPATAIILAKTGNNVSINVAPAAGITSFSQNNGGGLLMEWYGDKSMRVWGDVLPSHDDLRGLGNVNQRFKNVYLALPNSNDPSPNTFPFVIVGDPAQPSRLAYYGGLTKTCGPTIVVRHGLVISC